MAPPSASAAAAVDNTPLARLLGLPSFLFAVFVLYWSLPIGVLCGSIAVFKWAGTRNDMFGWAQMMAAIFSIQFKQVGSNSLYMGPRCLYLCNHRSWADFFVDTYLTGGRAALMSRALVFFVFPVFCTAVKILQGIIVFRRGHIIDKEKFNAWLDTTLHSSVVPGFLVFPEGHRSLRQTSLPLKRGMLHYAYSRQLPVQLIVSRNKEAILSEKTLRARFNVTIVTSYSQVIDPQQFATFEAFFNRIQGDWNGLWASVFSADLAGTKPVTFPSQQLYPYSTTIKARMLAFSLLSVVLLAAVLYFSWRALAGALLMAGPLQPLVAAGLAAWVAVSMWRSTMPHSHA